MADGSLWLRCPGAEFSQLHIADSGHAVPAGEQLLLQDVCLLLGTSLGYLQLHAEDGQLLHRQRLHTSSAQTVSARVTGMGKTSALPCALHMDSYLICHTFNFS